MKKNLLSIVILALLIVNIVLTSIMMFSVVGTNKKTASVVGNIASVLQLETTKPKTEEGEEEVSLENTKLYDIEDQLIIPLKNSEDGITHYAAIHVSLSMNMLHEDYAKYGETIAEKKSLIKGEINGVIGGYTLEEIQQQAGIDSAKAEILKRIQGIFDSDFIYNVTISDVVFQ